MRNSLRWALPLTLAITAALFVNGCERAAHSNEAVRVRVWSMWSGDEEKAFVRVIDEYNRTHPGVRLENLGSVNDDKTIRAIVAGAPPDVVTIADPSNLGALAANDALLPLDDKFSASGLHDADYTRASLTQCRYNNRLYAIPYLIDCMVLLYNKQVFRDVGLDPEKPPQTLEELEADCKKITKRGSDGRLKRIGLRPPEPMMLFGIYGGAYSDPKTGRITADDSRHLEAIKEYSRLMDAQGGNEATEAFTQGFANSQGSYNPFFLGQVGMTFNGQWNTYWVSRYKPDLDYGVAPLPYPANHPERKGGAWLGGNLFVIPKESKHKKEAWDFLAWTQTLEAQRLFAEGIRGVPNIRAALQDKSLRTGAAWKEKFGIFMDLSDGPNATHFPPMPVASLYVSEMGSAVDAVRYGRKSPEQALSAVRGRVQQEMNHYQ